MNVNDSPSAPSLPPRERILQAAHRLFYRDGIRATGIDRIIAESGVAKLTFYRQFPSKNDLVHAYLEYRHARWMAWFTDALQRHAGSAGVPEIAALVPALREWFRDGHFRGCAFINGLGEVGATMPEVVEIVRRHKQEMTDAIAQLLPPSRQRTMLAQEIALAVDGAIIRAQFDPTPDAALKVLARLLAALGG